MRQVAERLFLVFMYYLRTFSPAAFAHQQRPVNLMLASYSPATADYIDLCVETPNFDMPICTQLGS
jgi:hypothetical protein